MFETRMCDCWHQCNLVIRCTFNRSPLGGKISDIAIQMSLVRLSLIITGRVGKAQISQGSSE